MKGKTTGVSDGGRFHSQFPVHVSHRPETSGSAPRSQRQWIDPFHFLCRLDLRVVRLELHDLREVLQRLGGELEDVAAAAGAARLLDLLEGAAELSELPEVVVRLQLEGHETVVRGGARELYGSGVAVQVLALCVHGRREKETETEGTY